MYSQNDPKWKNLKLGNSELTIGADGCKLTALSWIVKKTPDVVNEILKKGGAFSGALLTDSICAEVLDLEFNGRSTTPPDYMCIAETIWSKASPLQHFVIYENGHILDTWDGLQKTMDTHPIQNYRLFKVKDVLEPPKLTPVEVSTQNSAQVPINIVSSTVEPSVNSTSIPEVQEVGGVIPMQDTPTPMQKSTILDVLKALIKLIKSLWTK